MWAWGWLKGWGGWGGAAQKLPSSETGVVSQLPAIWVDHVCLLPAHQQGQPTSGLHLQAKGNSLGALTPEIDFLSAFAHYINKVLTSSFSGRSSLVNQRKAGIRGAE